MDPKLLSDIQGLIAKSLPSMEANTFKKYVEEAEKLKVEFDKLKEDYFNVKNNHEKLFNEYKNLQSLKLENDKINFERKSLENEKMKFDYEKKLKDKEIECEKGKVALINDLVSSLFRNTIIRERALGQVPCINRNPDGSQYVTNTNIDLDTQKKSE